MRTLILSLILSSLPACGEDALETDLGVGDLGGDANEAACPAAAPSFSSCTKADAVCTYPGSRCTCKGGSGSLSWYCVDPACPTNASSGQSCSTANLSCMFGFEYGCNCVAPENVWACCGGVSCGGSGGPPPKDGSPCCGSSAVPCSFTEGDAGVTCQCLGSHWKCG